VRRVGAVLHELRRRQLQREIHEVVALREDQVLFCPRGPVERRQGSGELVFWEKRGGVVCQGEGQKVRVGRGEEVGDGGGLVEGEFLVGG
jgi:hypothetical protein